MSDSSADEWWYAAGTRPANSNTANVKGALARRVNAETRFLISSQRRPVNSWLQILGRSGRLRPNVICWSLLILLAQLANCASAVSTPFLIFSFLFDWFFLWIFHFQRVSNFFEIDGECDVNSKISSKVILFCRPLKLRKSRSCETEDWRSRGYKTSKYSRLVKGKNDFFSEKNIPWIAYSWKKLNIALGICYLVTLKFLYCFVRHVSL